MKCNAERLVEGLIRAQMAEYQHQLEQKQNAARHYVVTVSRGYGSQGKDVAQQLAQTLGVRCCDRYILREVSRMAHVDEDLVAVLDEHVSKIDEHWWTRLLSQKKQFSVEDYYHYLVKVVLSISQAGGVIVGRGAHMILGPDLCFRVRIEGGPEQCAQRIAERESVSVEQAARRVADVDRERMEYIRCIYGVDITDHAQYDLVLNSDNCSVDQLVTRILQAMQQAGYQFSKELAETL